jgi:hypothetical protein
LLAEGLALDGLHVTTRLGIFRIGCDGFGEVSARLGDLPFQLQD